MQNVVDDKLGFYDCTDFLQQQDSSKVLHNLVDRIESAKEADLIKPVEDKDPFAAQLENGKVRTLYRS